MQGAPYITLANFSPPSSINFETLTCQGGAWNVNQGFTGADWVQTGFTSGNSRAKKEGAGQLTIAQFTAGAALTLGNNTYNVTPSWNNNDAWNPSDGSTPSGSGDFANAVTTYTTGTSQIDCGVVYSNIFAPDNQYKDMHWVGKAINGTYVVTATLSDASASPATLTLAANTGFVCTFHGGSPSCTLSVEVRRTVASGSAGVIFPQIAWITVPTKVPLPKGFKKQLMQVGISGGANG